MEEQISKKIFFKKKLDNIFLVCYSHGQFCYVEIQFHILKSGHV